MWSLLFILCIALSCGIRAEVVIRVSGYEKADIYMSCPYDKDYKSNKKYLCRNNCGNGDVLITTTDKKSEKYSAYDDKKERVFRAKISDLSSKDAGSYWCGVTKTGIDHYPARVELKVVPDSCCDQSTNFQSHETGSVSISCEYDSKYQNNLKYFCRGAQPSTCLQQALIMSNSSRDTRQFTLTDDQASRIFTVTITRLTLKDAGRYLCGIHKNANLDVFSAIELEVEVFQTTSFTSTIVVETVRSQTDPSEPRTDASLLSPLVLISIVVAVLMPPILISALIIVYKCKCDRAQVDLAGDGVNRSRNTVNTADAEEVILEQIYENSDNGVYPKQKTSKELSTCHQFDVISGDQQDSVYENVTVTDNLYCNQIEVIAMRARDESNV